MFAAVRNVAFPAGLLEREKMKPIFSTEQARYQKFASFFIDVTSVSPFCVKVCATRKLSAGISLSALKYARCANFRATKALPLETATF